MNGLFPPLDYTLLVVGTLLVFAGLHRWLWRGRLRGALPLLIWVLVLTVLGSGWFFVEDSVRREQARMQQMMAGYAPTYAQEIGLMGHQEITLATSPDDPRYWRMLKAEQRWLAANPAISDIYTLRKLPDGRLARIVDSVTDAARGQPRRIGEIYGGGLFALRGQVARREIRVYA